MFVCGWSIDKLRQALDKDTVRVCVHTRYRLGSAIPSLQIQESQALLEWNLNVFSGNDLVVKIITMLSFLSFVISGII